MGRPCTYLDRIEAIIADMPKLSIQDIMVKYRISKGSVYRIRDKMHEDKLKKAREEDEAKERRAFEARQNMLFAEGRYEEYGYRVDQLKGEELLIYLEGPKHQLEGRIITKGA